MELILCGTRQAVVSRRRRSRLPGWWRRAVSQAALEETLRATEAQFAALRGSLDDAADARAVAEAEAARLRESLDASLDELSSARRSLQQVRESSLSLLCACRFS